MEDSGREVAVRLAVLPRCLTGPCVAGSHPRLFRKPRLQDGRSKWPVSRIGTRHFRPARPPSSTSESNPRRETMEPMHKRVAGLDVHRMKHVVTVLIEEKDGTPTKVTRQFGGFKRDLRELIGWLSEHRVERVVMESTGIYWKSVYASLSAAGIPALVVN